MNDHHHKDQQQEQKQNQELIIKIEKEKELSQKAFIEIEKQWKTILSHEKVHIIQQNIQNTIQQKCENEIKHKKEVIQKLFTSLDNVEDQFRVSVASHLGTMDEMIQMNDAIFCTIERNFHEKVNTLRNEYEEEKQIIQSKFESDKKTILNEMKCIDVEEKRIIDEHNRKEQQLLEEIKNKNLEDMNSLRFDLDTRIEDLDEQFEIAKNEYLQKTDVQSETLTQQLDKDKEMSKEMIKLQCQIDTLCASMKKLKSVSRRNSSQNMERNRRLLERKNEVIQKYRNTKAQLEELRSSRHGKLKEMTKQANTYKTLLQGENDLVERILKLLVLTGKMESEDEKQDLEVDLEGYDESHTKEGSTFQEEGIWRRYNKVLLSMSRLKEEEEDLLKTNRDLKDKLRRYQDGVTVNDRVINSHNPLIVINGKMRPESREFSKSSVGFSVIDANHLSTTKAN